MDQNDYTSEFVVSQGPEAVYATVVAVRQWWGGDIAGSAEAVGDEFTYRYEDLHFSRQRVTELVPERRVAWHVIDGQISFIANPGEWNGTDIVFDILPQDGGALVRITHLGLVPRKECFEACSGGWNHYFGQSLKAAIERAGGAESGGTNDAGILAASIAVARSGLEAQSEIMKGPSR